MEQSLKQPQAYLASPLGFSEAGRYFYERELLPAVAAAGYSLLDPWALAPAGLLQEVAALPFGAEKRERWRELNGLIGRTNAEAIRRASLVVAVLDGVDVDSGTAAEIGFAAALGKRIVGYRGDFRLSADNEGGKVNLQVEYFINASGGAIVATLDQLRQMIAEVRQQLPVC